MSKIEVIMMIVNEIENKLNENGEIDKEKVVELIDKVKEYGNGKSGLENGRMKELLDILDESKRGISKIEIMERMGISKGNFGSLVMYIRKRGIEVLKVGDKYILGKYIKIGEDME